MADSRLRLLSISVSRTGFRNILEPEDTRRIGSIQLSLIDAEILFDKDGTAKLMSKDDVWGMRLFGVNTSGSVGYWEATDEEMATLRRSGYSLADWRNLSVADIAKQHPDW
ncbi:MAG: hypothetical protein ABSB35_30700 [Bryobacteraceae bacterium]|jgi:hypothetical protein